MKHRPRGRKYLPTGCRPRKRWVLPTISIGVKQHQVFLAKIQDLTQQPNKSNAGQPVDDSETEPESDIEHLPESPATPAEFTRWYNKVHLQAGSTKQMVDSETEPELEISKQERKSPIDFIYEAMINLRIFIFSISSPLTKKLQT